LFKGETLISNHNVTDSLESLNICEIFNGEIIESMAISTFCVVSVSAKGVQTAVSLSDRLEILKQELILRKVQLPVVLMIDGHRSRFHHIAADWFSRNQDYIIPFVLPPNTSTWSQPLDKINQSYHARPNAAKDEYKRLIAVQRNCDPDEVMLTQRVSHCVSLLL
jgi:hypothetical protein